MVDTLCGGLTVLGKVASPETFYVLKSNGWVSFSYRETIVVHSFKSCTWIDLCERQYFPLNDLMTFTRLNLIFYAPFITKSEKAILAQSQGHKVIDLVVI